MITDSAFTIFSEGAPLTLHRDDTRFDEALELLKDEDYDAIIDLINIERSLKWFVSETTDITIDNGVVYYKNKPMYNYAATKLIQIYRAKLPVEPLCAFIANTMENPSKRAVDDLLTFLEYGNMPITEDGHFLAYKRVNHDYKDMHSKTIDNSVGQVVSMDRNEVDDNPNNTCSYGLHFCSLEYVASFWGEKTMVLKINPKDVVAIPVDYNNTKGRCSKYKVVSELDSLPQRNVLGESPINTDYEDDHSECYDCGADVDPTDSYCSVCGYEL